MSNAPLDAPVVYQIRPRDRAAHLFEVSCLVSEPVADAQLFSMPAWIPGSYLVRDYARHVVSVSAEVHGDEVPVHKVDKSTWRVADARGPILLTAEIYAYDLSVRGAFLDHGHAFINGVCTFFMVHGFEAERCVVHVMPPRNEPDSPWRVATGLPRLTGTELDFGAFVAGSYDELIDHPFLLGDLTVCEFDVLGVPHRLALTGPGRQAADFERLCSDLTAICESHMALFDGFAPFDDYTFLLTVLNSGYGGLEHRNSSALVCGCDDLPRAGVNNSGEGYRKLLGLFSHEYFHAWNVKRIKPMEFVPYDLARENYTRQLWVFEGITSYYDDLALLRSGVVDLDAYLELLGVCLTRVYRSRGRRKQTLEDSSFDAWIKFYRQDENSPNAIVSYYSKGAMVALALDLELRLQTGGGCSLDVVMRELWRRYGSAESRGLPEDAFEALAEELSGLDLSEFFRQSLRTTVDPPVGILLAQFGLRLNMRPAENEADQGGKSPQRKGPPRPWLGVRARTAEGRVFVATVEKSLSTAGGPALSADDEIVAINGRRVTAGNYESLLTGLPVDSVANLAVFRRDELLRVGVVAAAPPRDRCYLSIDPEADADAVSRRVEWLGVS